jgi:hypothetical protein
MAWAAYTGGKAMSAQPNPLVSAKPAIGIEVDAARNLARVCYAGQVSAAELKAGVKEIERRLPMALDCVPHVAKIMDLCKAHGVGLVVRVSPDPAKDIGFNILSVTHYRGKVRVVTRDTLAEAERALE